MLQVSRRTFLKASAATTALASLGAIEFQSWQTLYANEKENITITPSFCNACSSKCGILVYSKNGRLWKVAGHPDHPFSKGKICARGHGIATIAYSPDRIKEPLKRKEDGTFEPISWEQAYQEIGQKLKEIVAKDPGSVVFVEDPRPTGKFYGPRFLDAIGSPNYFNHLVVCSNARDTGFTHTIGGVPGGDVANSKYIMFIGRSYGDGVRPASVQALGAAKDNGAYVVIVDPRLNNTAPLADEWLSIRPGTDLALVLAMSNVLVTEELYDKEFIANYAVGFEEYAKTIQEYTPEWAEKVTGISKDTISRIARDMAKAKPKVMIEQSWRGGFGCTYANSAETGRAVALFNALLGNIQQKGGYIFGKGPKLGKLDPTIHPTPSPSTLPRVDAEFPLVNPHAGVASVIPQKAKAGIVKAAIIIQTNPVRGYSDPNYMIEGLRALELSVVIDVQMSETAMVADYVLPEPSYLERDDVIEALPGGKPAVCLRQKTIDVVHPNTVPADQIFTEIAKAMGLGHYFNFTVDELNQAMIAPLGITLSELKKKGTIVIDDPVELGVVPKLKTPSGKVEFVSENYAKAGFSPVVKWMEPKVKPDQDSFRLITGKQSYHTHSYTTNLPYLLQITKDYNSERLWINKKRGIEMGLKDGDLVEVESANAKSQVKVKLTERIHPECVFVPSPYGNFSDGLHLAKGVGFSYMDHVPYQVDPIGGTSMIHEVIVKIRKVGI
ncbi:molybdopterin-dependent oxidoreductase [Tepidibacillus infernus]|uniref:molybdopterin-containing oxidoreductase family protein n=1 Tax=Tepidibacillus infernus TaxID=1806172 RepID=UPI003B71D2EB